MAENENVKPKYTHAKKLNVNKVILELAGKDNDLVHRIRLDTDAGDLTYKPRKKAEISSEMSGFFTVAKTTELPKVSEFVTENPMLKELSVNCKKEPQEITVSFAEISRIDDDDEVIWYKFLRDYQFKTIYYAKYHKDDSNLQQQKEWKQKYVEKEL